LYTLLTATQCFNAVTASHLIRYDEMLFNHVTRREDEAKQQLDELFKSLDVKDRFIDAMPVTPDLVEEYGFVFQKRGHGPGLSPKNLPVFVELCKKVQFVSVPGRPLLLKNPWDFRNFTYIKRACPRAKFIFIHRHPIYVINSQLRAVRLLLASRNAYLALLAPGYAKRSHRSPGLRLARLVFSSHSNLGLSLITWHFVRGARYFLRHIGSLPKADYISVRYEELCEDPETSVAKILTFLGLEQHSIVGYDGLVASRSPHLLPEVFRRYKSIHRRIRPYYAYLGYGVLPEL
jgi:hypothetical protein